MKNLNAKYIKIAEANSYAIDWIKGMLRAKKALNDQPIPTYKRKLLNFK